MSLSFRYENILDMKSRICRIYSMVMRIYLIDCIYLFREQPIFTCKAHVFHIDPKTKRSWLPASSAAVNVSFFYDSSRGLYRIISVEGTKVCIQYYVLCIRLKYFFLVFIMKLNILECKLRNDIFRLL